MRKLLLAMLVFVVFLSGPTFAARQKMQGWCEDGNTAVTIAGTSGSGTQTFQRSYSACTVTVYDTGTTNLSTVYSDAAGTAKANPFTAASSGQWFFYVDSPVDVRFSGGGITTPFTRGDWPVYPVFDASDFTGATAGAKIANAIAALPSVGGTVDARSLSGAQTISSDPFVGVTKPVTLLLGAGTYTLSVTMTIPTSHISITGISAAKLVSGATNAATIISYTGTGTAISVTGGSTTRDFQLRNLTVTTASGASVRAVDFGTSLYNKLENVELVGTGKTGIGINMDDLSFQHVILHSHIRAFNVGIEARSRNHILTIANGCEIVRNSIGIRLGGGSDGVGAGATAPTAAGGVIQGNSIELNDTVDLDVVTGNSTNIVGNYFEGAQAADGGGANTRNIRIGNGAGLTTRNLEIHANYFNGGSSTLNYAIQLIRGDHINVSGNAFNAYATGALLNTATTVSNNSFGPNFLGTLVAGLSATTGFKFLYDPEDLNTTGTTTMLMPLDLEGAPALKTSGALDIQSGGTSPVRFGRQSGAGTGGLEVYAGGTSTLSFKVADGGGVTIGGASFADIDSSGTALMRFNRNGGTGGVTIFQGGTATENFKVANADGATTTRGLATFTNGGILLNDPSFNDIYWAGASAMRFGRLGGTGGVTFYKGGTSTVNFSLTDAGAATFPTSLAIGATGTAITKHFSATSVQDLGSISANTCLDSSAITVTGATDGSTVTVGVLATVASTAGLQFTAYVSAADAVKVRACNETTGAIDPASTTYRVDVWVH